MVLGEEKVEHKTVFFWIIVVHAMVLEVAEPVKGYLKRPFSFFNNKKWIWTHGRKGRLPAHPFDRILCICWSAESHETPFLSNACTNAIPIVGPWLRETVNIKNSHCKCTPSPSILFTCNLSTNIVLYKAMNSTHVHRTSAVCLAFPLFLGNRYDTTSNSAKGLEDCLKPCETLCPRLPRKAAKVKTWRDRSCCRYRLSSKLQTRLFQSFLINGFI